ncbi:MAG: gfo/Idh/MocA family oxidoreductase, partial [Limisphaerales bacterium]
NISYRLGKKTAPGEARERLKDQKGLQESYDRMVEHLKKNEVNLDVDQLTLGVGLAMDPTTERFIGNKDADKLLTRDYRKPFVVPEKV